MFNSISKAKACEIFLERLPWTIPLFDMLYTNDTIMIYTQPDRQKGKFSQEEGSQQGCPFRGLILNMVLTSIYNQLESELTTQVVERKKGGP